jgi:hypothetical protein
MLRTLLFVVAATGTARADCDLSTDAGVDAAFKAATGREMDKQHRCATASSTFPGLVRVGSFAYDRGCITAGVLVGCKLSPSGFEAAAMKRAGWTTADATKRLALARAWLREVDDMDLVDTAPAKFGGKKFSLPALTPSGKVWVFEAWLEEPPGMQPVTYFSKVHLEFAADGSHGTAKTTDSVDVPIH